MADTHEIQVNDEEWQEYKKKFNKTYEKPEDDKLRRELYTATKKKIHEHNKKYEAGEVTYTMGINQFADNKEGEGPCGCLRRPKNDSTK